MGLKKSILTLVPVLSLLRSSPTPITSWTASAAPQSAPRSSSRPRAWSTCWVGNLHTHKPNLINKLELLECNSRLYMAKVQMDWKAKAIFFHLCPSVRRGGGVPRHQASGARHQGNSRVLWEAAAAPEGHQPRVEQPNGLHVAGQAHRKMLWNEHADACAHLPLCYGPIVQNGSLCWSQQFRAADDTMKPCRIHRYVKVDLSLILSWDPFG